MEFKKEFMEKVITTKVDKLDYGITLQITGGSKTHVGAVTIIDESGQEKTESFPGHKDHYISQIWAKRLYELLHEPVVVIVGIHYDDISKEEIVQICMIAEEMLNGVCKALENCLREKN